MIAPGRKIPENQVPDVEWTSLDDRQPPDGKLVLVKCAMVPPRVQIDELESGFVWRYNARLSTHWAYLPMGWMMDSRPKRVSARAPKNIVPSKPLTALELELESNERGDLQRQATAEADDRIMAWLRKIDRAAYSVEVGEATGITQSLAANRLRALEEAGELISHKEKSPISGLGRRYYLVV